MTESFRIAIAGLGTVGCSVVKILQENAGRLAQRAGRPLEIVGVSARKRDKERSVDLSSYSWFDRPLEMADPEKVDVVVELIGGDEGVAYDLVDQTLGKGISVVTANKALLASHGRILASRSDQCHAPLMYEAAVAGGIPIIKSLGEGYSANNIKSVYGILNGTCNYILSEMESRDVTFNDVLTNAQELGYAEADPAFDIEGYDTAHKTSLITALARGVFPCVYEDDIQGITDITADDIAFARELGYKIRLLGVTKSLDGGILQYVAPCLIPATHILASVNDVFNAVLVDGDFVDTGFFVGRGAGGGPTASAVVADLVDLARGRVRPVFGVPSDDLEEASFVDTGKYKSRFYLRLNVIDRPGVLSALTAIMKDHGISIASFLQRSRNPDKPVPIVLTTHIVETQAVRKAVEEITALDVTRDTPCLLRIEEF